MKRILISFCIYIFLCGTLYADEPLLLIKQKLERIDRDISDLQKELFGNKNKQQTIENNNLYESSEVTVFDMRLRDIENELKGINLNYENLAFDIEELKNNLDELSFNLDELSLKLDNNIISQNNNNINQNSEVVEDISEDVGQKNELENKNTLGTLKISTVDLSESSTEELIQDDQNLNLLPKEQFQMAFDYLRTQKFVEAKLALEKFVKDHSSHELAGPAQYWLGELSLLKKTYREAALIFAEGYQKYPESSKAPDTLYKLAEALVKIEKKNEACNTLNQFILKYPNHNLTDKTKSKINDLECN